MIASKSTIVSSSIDRKELLVCVSMVDLYGLDEKRLAVKKKSALCLIYVSIVFHEVDGGSLSHALG